MGQQRGRKRSPSRADTSYTFRHFFRRRLFSSPSRFTLSSVRPTDRPTVRPSVHPFVLPFTFFWTAEARGRTTESPSHRCRRRRTLSRSPASFSINPLSGPHDRRGGRHTRRSRPWVCEIFKSIARARPPRYTQFSPRGTAISPRCFLKLIASKCQKG